MWPRVLERLFGPQLPQQLRLELTRDLGRLFLPFLIVAAVAAVLALGVAVTVRSTFAMFFAGLGIAGFGFILLACQSARRPLDSELQEETEARYGLGTTVVATALGGIVVSVLATDASMVLQSMVVMVALAALGVGSAAWRGRPELAIVQALCVSVPTAAALALRWPVPSGYATALGVLVYGVASMMLARRGYRAQLALIEARDDQRAERNRMRVAMEHMGQAVAVLDTALKVVMINRSALELLGLDRVDDVNPPRFDDLLAAAPNLVKAAGNQEELLAQADLLITARQPFNGVLRLNDDRVIDLECLPIPDGGWVAMLRDSTGERHAIAELNREIRRCPLTGLPNRRGFLEELERRLARGEAFALMIVDLDGFKQVNDRHGHSVGDRMITRIGFRLRTADPALYAARLGGDEFAVLAEIDSGDAAVALAQRLVDTIDAPARFGEAEVQVGAAIGVAMAPDDGVLVETLLRAADLALLAAKSQPGNQIRLFTADLLEKSAQVANLEARVRSALRNGRVDVAYQPLVELATGKVVAVEALARWRDDGGALVSPEQLVAVAEARGLVSDLRRLVLTEAAATIAAEGSTLDLWVNASVHDLRQPGMVGEVTATLAAVGLSPSRLAVEITETALMTEEDGCNANLSALNALGVTVAMDDFGAGFSSLDRLRRLPINALKISGSLLHGAAEDRLAGDIFRMAASLGRAMGLTLIAEGVETEAELALARANGIDRGQGFLLAAPVPADQLHDAIAAAERAAREAVWLRAAPAKTSGKGAAAAKPATRTAVKTPTKAPAKAPTKAASKASEAAKTDEAMAGKAATAKAAAAARPAPAKAAAPAKPPLKAVAPGKARVKAAAPAKVVPAVKPPLKAAAPARTAAKPVPPVKAAG
ncbi:putative bifunctional diguanylate cyclase/phosphodiesterase, partial [Sandarakinorhabdus rubra]|uniref:putative bifunctional diguanylate cyclase/phosphodiesterase n=1 Tax=Sandarakinorhabdus rubra TaxID=2672568 RepID=UPI0013DC8947